MSNKSVSSFMFLGSPDLAHRVDHRPRAGRHPDEAMFLRWILEPYYRAPFRPYLRVRNRRSYCLADLATLPRTYTTDYVHTILPPYKCRVMAIDNISQHSDRSRVMAKTVCGSCLVGQPCPRDSVSVLPPYKVGNPPNCHRLEIH